MSRAGLFPRQELTLSGLVGDLDPHLSRYTLAPLKVAYKKLRVLIDRGCIFIGHGLSKDFRIISEKSSSSLDFPLFNCS